jgi:hypothetical protein
MCCTTIAALLFSSTLASAQESLERLPDPVRAYGSQFAPYCSALGKPGVVTNEMYSDALFGAPDINHDGEPDYVEYKCMFGCEGAPFAFVGLGAPCRFGALLLSSEEGYKTVAIPGTITQLDQGPPLSIAVTRRPIHAHDCDDDSECSYLFELREGRFQLVTPCPADGCRMHVSERQ